MANKPKKYRANMSDQILTTALDALKYLQTANSIFFTKISSEADYLTRRRLLQTGKGYIENVSTVFYIFIETVRKHDSENDDRLYKQEMEVGDACNTIIKRIDGILKSDKEISYYATQANRIKKQGHTGSAGYWWLRSPYSTDGFCNCNNGGNPNNNNATNTNLVAPFGYVSIPEK